MIAILGTFLGGLGLFLLSVSMITDGLKLAAGDALRGILARSTSTRLRGVASGIVVTSVVQSSSAVTVATIGFVNAGLLTMVQAIGVVYGANVGTTMTGWLVAAVGFQLNIEAVALPLIGLGMLGRLLGASSRIGAVGEALAGFGLFFIGVDVLRDAFQVFAANLDFATVSPSGIGGTLLYVLFGFLMTVVTQSSSAAIAITLTAATGGVLAIDAAAALVIGANVGTTSTAAFAVIGATPNARRVAAAHVVFNLASGTVALLLLAPMLWFVRATGTLLDLADIPAVTLALFHTVFNVLGLILMWPITERLAHELERRFGTQAEALGRPRYLDRNVLVAPDLAVDALRLELTRMADLARTLALASISAEHGARPADLQRALTTLTAELVTFVAQLERTRIPKDLARRLPEALRINAYLEEVSHLSGEITTHIDDITSIRRARAAELIAAYEAAISKIVAGADPARPDFDPDASVRAYEELRLQWKALKVALLESAANREIGINRLNDALEALRTMLRVAEQSGKAARWLANMSRALTGGAAPLTTDSEPTPGVSSTEAP